MDIGLVITKHSSEGRTWYSARWVVGSGLLDERSGEKWRCNAAGKTLESCIAAVRERALIWAKEGGIADIEGLTSGELCILNLHQGEDIIELVPVTYNDWLTQKTV